MIEHTADNCDKLAEHIVDDMDLKDMVRIITDQISDQFKDDPHHFKLTARDYDWESDNGS